MLYPVTTATREVASLNGIWQLAFDPQRLGIKRKFFSRTPDKTIEIAVPGSINEQVNDRDLYTNMDWVWYFRDFRVGGSWRPKRIAIRFGSVNFRAEVFLNGQRLGQHEGGYLPFEFDITDLVRFDGSNRLAVRVDNLLDETTIPQGNISPKVGGVASWRPHNFPNVHYDYFPFTGIHRNVDLVASEPVRLAAVRLTTQALKGTRANVLAEVTTTGGADCVRLSIDELKFATEIALSRGKGTAEFVLPKIVPWCPKTPKLYDVQLETVRRGEVTDVYALPFGFRTVAVKRDKIVLNGKPVFLRGFGRHEDTAVAGKGMNLPYLVKDYQNLKWIGANSFRTSHYPYCEEDMFMADRQGMLVIDEVAANTLSMRAVREGDSRNRLLANHKSQIKDLIDRDYNHPSVIMWSLCNECETNEPDATKYFPRAVRYARSLDAARPITMVTCNGPQDRCAQHVDVILTNIYPGWYGLYGQYERIPQAVRRHLSALRKKFNKPILISEFGAGGIPGMHTEHDLMWSEEYQVEVVSRVIAEAEKCPYVVGTHVWVLNDFKVGQHVNRVMCNWKGVFTRDRHPKMCARELRKIWQRPAKRK